MADGVRIQPQRAALAARGVEGSPAGRMIVLRDVGRPLPPHPQRAACKTCGVPHEFKTYHFQLDGEGTIIVSTGIWERLMQMPDHGGFEPVNVVPKPPAQGLVLPPAKLRIQPAKM